MRRINEIAFHRYVFSFVEFPSSLFFFFFLESINPFITKEAIPFVRKKILQTRFSYWFVILTHASVNEEKEHEIID